MFEWDYAYVDDCGVVEHPELDAFRAEYTRFSDQGWMGSSVICCNFLKFPPKI